MDTPTPTAPPPSWRIEDFALDDSAPTGGRHPDTEHAHDCLGDDVVDLDGPTIAYDGFHGVGLPHPDALFSGPDEIPVARPACATCCHLDIDHAALDGGRGHCVVPGCVTCNGFAPEGTDDGE